MAEVVVVTEVMEEKGRGDTEPLASSHLTLPSDFGNHLDPHLDFGGCLRYTVRLRDP